MWMFLIVTLVIVSTFTIATVMFVHTLATKVSRFAAEVLAVTSRIVFLLWLGLQIVRGIWMVVMCIMNFICWWACINIPQKNQKEKAQVPPGQQPRVENVAPVNPPPA
jgi:predicted membrane protein